MNVLDYERTAKVQNPTIHAGTISRFRTKSASRIFDSEPANLAKLVIRISLIMPTRRRIFSPTPNRREANVEKTYSSMGLGQQLMASLRGRPEA